MANNNYTDELLFEQDVVEFCMSMIVFLYYCPLNFLQNV